MDLAALMPGLVLDRYVVESFIGSGGMATVLKVRHRQLGTHHALKVLNIASGTIRERLVTEGRMQGALRHQNVVKVTDLVTLEGGAPGLIMEFVEGPNLDELLEERRLSLSQADHLAQGILAGVEEAHRHGLVHRDLKPANILLQPAVDTWIPKVADFGIAKVVVGDGEQAGRTRTGVTMGTPNYMAPEQARDAKNIGPTADIFALGAILYELVTNQRCFDGEDVLETLNAVAHAQYVPVLERVSNTPAGMVRAIEAALQVDPEARPQSVDDLRALWVEGRPPLTQPVPFEGVKARVFPAPPTGSTTIRESLLGAEGPPRLDPGQSVPLSDPKVEATARRNRVGLLVLGAGLVSAMLVGATVITGFVAVQQLTRDEDLGPTADGTPPAADVVNDVAVEEPVLDEPVLDEPVVDEPVVADAKPVPLPEPVVAAPVTPEPAPVVVPEDVQDVAVPDDVPPTVEVPTPAPDLPMTTPGRTDDDATAEVVPPFAGLGLSGTTTAAPIPSTAVVTSPAPRIDAEALAYIQHPDVSVRKKRIKNLAHMGDGTSAELLGMMMKDDADPTIRRLAWEAVEENLQVGHGETSVFEDHAGWQLEHGDDGLAMAAVKVLTSRGSRPGLLAPGLRRRSLDVRLATLDAVAALPPRDRVTLRSEIERLTHEDNERLVRRAQDVLALMP